MNPLVGWSLVGLLAFFAWRIYGPLEGLALAATATVFWLVLQWNRTIRTMTKAGQRPLGHVPSAVMLNARLRAGMTMLQVVTETGSLGRKDDAAGERWSWQDEGDSRVELVFERGKLARWTLVRPEAPPP